jgi:hypothetical protein
MTRLRLCFCCLSFAIAGCASNSDTMSSGYTGSPISGYRGSSIAEAGAKPSSAMAPEMKPERKIEERDCTQPAPEPVENLRCK